MKIVENMSGDWELIADDEVVGVCERMTRDEAAECFAANWPQYADAIGAPEHGRRRQAASRTVSDKLTGIRKVGSGQRFRELILGGAGNAEALAKVREEFPDSKATLSDAAWNRRELKVNGHLYDEHGFKIGKGRDRSRPSDGGNELWD